MRGNIIHFADLANLENFADLADLENLMYHTRMLETLQSFAEPWLLFLSQDPTLRLLQVYMLLAGVFMIFLVFFVTRDILLRTHSFLYMFTCIVLVAGLPIVGFFLYLLIRPPRTLKERESAELLSEILSTLRTQRQRDPYEKKSGIVKKKTKSGKTETEEEVEL